MLCESHSAGDGITKFQRELLTVLDSFREFAKEPGGLPPPAVLRVSGEECGIAGLEFDADHAVAELNFSRARSMTAWAVGASGNTGTPS